jgi:glycosyltransferase involved in cell wall biosynthesis
VAGEACILLDEPTDPAATADAMAQLAGDELKRKSLSGAGLERAARFTPAETAASVVGIYAELLGISI